MYILEPLKKGHIKPQKSTHISSRDSNSFLLKCVKSCIFKAVFSFEYLLLSWVFFFFLHFQIQLRENRFDFFPMYRALALTSEEGEAGDEKMEEILTRVRTLVTRQRQEVRINFAYKPNCCFCYYYYCCCCCGYMYCCF